MSVFILNNPSNPFNALDYAIINHYLDRGVTIRSLVGTVTIPARSAGQFYFLYACANQDGSDQALVAALSSAAKPNRDVAQFVAAIGTEPGNSNLMRQHQRDKLVQFHGDYTFDAAIGEPGGFTTNTWAERPSFGAWPPGVCAAVYFRAEAWRITDADAAGLQIAQLNVVGVRGTHGGAGGPDTMGFITQEKGLVRLNQGGETSVDMLRVVIDAANDDIWVRAATSCKGFLLNSGYELR